MKPPTNKRDLISLSERVCELEKRMERLESFLRLDVFMANRRLTKRDAEVLRLIALDNSSLQICQKLNIPMSLVKQIRAGLHQKLGTDGSIARLILVAHQMGLIQSDGE